MKFDWLWALNISLAVYEIKLVNITRSKESEVVPFALVVDSIELGKSWVWRLNMAVTQEAPYLTQSHGKRLFRFCCFNFLGVLLVPVLKIGIVSQKNVLTVFLNLLGVLLKVYQIRQINQLLERILFNLLLCSLWCFSFWWIRFFFFILLSPFFLFLRWGSGLCLIDLPVYHSVLEEWSIILGSIFESEHTMTVLEVLMPISLIFTAIWVIEGTFSMTKPIEPVTDISVS